MEKEKIVARAFGKVLRAQRVSADLTQGALGIRARLGRRYISNLEMGRHVPSMVTVVTLAMALEMRVEALMVLVEDELKNNS